MIDAAVLYWTICISNSGFATICALARKCVAAEPFIGPPLHIPINILANTSFRFQSKGLRTWEKWYWGIFAGAVGVFLFNRIGGPAEEAEPDWELLRRRRHEAARRVGVGGCERKVVCGVWAGLWVG